MAKESNHHVLIVFLTAFVAAFALQAPADMLSVTDGLVIHYAPGGYTDPGGGNDGVWANSGSAGTAVNATHGGGGSPTPEASASDLNNQPAVKFNGGDQLTAFYDPALFAADQATVFVVANVGASSTYELLWSSGTGGTYTSFGGGGYSGLFRNSRVEGTYGGMPHADNSSDLFETISSDSGFEVLLNGGIKGTAAADFHSQGKLDIGNDDDGLGPFTGEIAEVLIYNRLLTDSETKTVNAELAATYGLTVSNVPEPSSMILLGSGAIFLFKRRQAGV